MSGRLILLMSVSLDGYVARTDGRIDWLGRSGRHGDQRHRLNLELFGQLEAMVMGSGAYLEFKEGWSGSDNPMARFMNAMPKVVFSQSLEEVKRAAGKDLVIFGGARIAHSAIREGLVDEYRLTVHPVMLGDGLSFMRGQPEPVRLELVSSTAYTDGSVMQVLRPA
jgi:dihydrofolate reductase